MQTALTDEQLKDFDVKDLYSPEVIANPYPYYVPLRGKPIQFGLEDFPPGTMPGVDKPVPAWVVTTHKDVTHVCRNHKIFSSRDKMQEGSEASTLMLVNDDPPRHSMLRAIAQKAFTPKRVEADVSPWMVSTVNRLLEDIGTDEIDFMTDLAPNLPALVMTKLIGTPEEEYHLLRKWANAFMVTGDFTIEERRQCNVDLWNYYSDKVDERYEDIEKGKAAPDDLMSAFIRAESEGNKLTKDEVKRFCITLVVAGAETTGYLLGNLIDVLLQEPSLFRQVQDDRSLVRPFIEESLRRDGPIQRLHRECIEDTDIGGVPIKAGDWVAIFFASANRDPAVFERPDDFILKRKNIGRHMTFSHGIHHCMGSGIARNEAEKLLNGIFDRYAGIAPGAAPGKRQTGGLLNYGLESLPIRFMPK
ncbi:MAG: cytochrome P450 [Pseudomonadota bacterium]